ncbi:MAG: hypothetical protein PHU23_07150 [Dehalococcoidales bacterium]|nr:hypothetical protein [Dehalococcoidales bacterium]
MDIDETLRSARVIRFLNNGSYIQLLCSDERGLLSVYFEPEKFGRFYKKLCKAGLALSGLLIRFNRYLVNVPSLGNGRHIFPLLSR